MKVVKLHYDELLATTNGCMSVYIYYFFHFVLSHRPNNGLLQKHVCDIE